VIVHSFSGPVDYAEAMLELGAVISFSGLVFRKGEESSADVARLAPQDRILVETDAPYLSPPGAPRGRNEPSWVGTTGRWIAELRGTDSDAFGARLVATYARVLGPPAGSPR
jgi:TatD DNase family protein